MKHKIISLICLTGIAAACGLCACSDGQTGGGQTLNDIPDTKITIQGEDGGAPDDGLRMPDEKSGGEKNSGGNDKRGRIIPSPRMPRPPRDTFGGGRKAPRGGEHRTGEKPARPGEGRGGEKPPEQSENKNED